MFGEIILYVIFVVVLSSNHAGSHILSLWMVQARCLGVFLSLAFTHQENICRDLLSLYDGINVCPD